MLLSEYSELADKGLATLMKAVELVENDYPTETDLTKSFHIATRLSISATMMMAFIEKQGLSSEFLVWCNIDE